MSTIIHKIEFHVPDPPPIQQADSNVFSFDREDMYFSGDWRFSNTV